MGVVGRLLVIGGLLGLGLMNAQQLPPPVKPSVPPPVEVEPPEEDEALKPKEYSFNPLEAQKDLRTGDYYFKKGNFKAAAKRFEEASLYDPSLADAYLRLGDAREKLHDKKGAKVAYQKFLELKPDSKLAPAIKKKVG